MKLLKQSTVYNLVVLMVDSSDHISGKTGLTLTLAASKDGGAFASITPTVTELSYGWYKIALTSGHTDTIGDLAIHISATGADPCDVMAQVRAVTTDELVRATTAANTLDVSSTGEAGLDFSNVKQATGATTLTNITVPVVTNVTNDVGITQVGADKVWGSVARALTDKADFALSSAAVTNLVNNVWSAGTRTLTSFGTLVSDVASAVWGAATRTLSAFGFTVATNSDANVTAMKAVIDTNLDMAISDIPLNVHSSIVLPVSVAQRAAMGKVEINPALTFRFSFASTYAGDLSAATKLWYAIKERDVEDANGLIFIEATDGLTVVNRAAYGTAAHGSIVVTGSAGDWTVSVFVDEVATSLLADQDGLECLSGVKALVAGEAVSLRDDECVVRLATVRAIS